MRLVSFSIKNYRSIRSAEKIAIGELTVLIGPNNEGKSNILRGLVSGMQILSRGPSAAARRATQTVYVQRGDEYRWERDFPMALQSTDPDGATVLDFEFELDSDEVDAFFKETKSKLNGSLPIRLSIRRERVLFEVRKKGPGGAALTSKQAQISRFIAQRINIRDIPSVRTASSAVELVDAMLEKELRVLDSSPEYRNAVEAIAQLQEPTLKALSNTVNEMLSNFLPDVKSVSIQIGDRYSALRRNLAIIVDDGSPTDLRFKGDGVQSLAALSLIHHVAQQKSGSAELVLAIEEPEAHLHPNAIHQLRNVLLEISSNQQVILTTHSPILVNRRDIGSNVIVDKSKAKRARSIKDIRQVLGVRVADNLSSANLVLIVEGPDDVVAIQGLVSHASKRLRSALSDGALAIDCMHGAGNLPYKASLLRDQLCNIHVFLDNDQAGQQAFKGCEQVGLLDLADVNFALVPGLSQSELEDMYLLDLYFPLVKRKWGVDLSISDFNKSKMKFSDRLRAAFLKNGKPVDDSTLMSIKNAIAELASSNPANAIRPEFYGPIESLVSQLDAKLGS